MKKLWAMNRPQTVDDFIFNDETSKETILEIIRTKNLPHLLLSGPRGTGKTSLAYLLKEQLNVDDMDFLKSNASDATSVNDVRGKIKNFISTIPIGEFKIVFLDEADRLSDEAFDALKNYIEEYSENARFIMTCNRKHKIPEEIRSSRLIEIDFTPLNADDLAICAVKTLKAHGIKIPELNIIDEYVTYSNGDCRSLLNLLQLNSSKGFLQKFSKADANYELKATAMVYLESGKWDDARKCLCDKLSDAEFLEMYRFLYDNLEHLDKFNLPTNWKRGIKIIAEYLYRHNFCSDKEINFAACMIELSDIK